MQHRDCQTVRANSSNPVLVLQTDALHPPAVNVLNVLAGSVQLCVKVQTPYTQLHMYVHQGTLAIKENGYCRPLG